MKYEFQVRMQQRHLKAIVGSAAQALPWGAGSAAQALPSGHGRGLGGGKRCLQDTGRVGWQALPSGHWSGLLAEGLALQEGCRSGL